MTQVFNSTTINPGETVTQQREIGRADVNVALFIVGDEESGDVSITFSTQPDDDVEIGQFFHAGTADEKNIDVTSGEVYKPSITPAERVEVSITNNGNTATVINAWLVNYLVH